MFCEWGIVSLSHPKYDNGISFDVRSMVLRYASIALHSALHLFLFLQSLQYAILHRFLLSYLILLTLYSDLLRNLLRTTA